MCVESAQEITPQAHVNEKEMLSLAVLFGVRSVGNMVRTQRRTAIIVQGLRTYTPSLEMIKGIFTTEKTLG